MIKEKFLNLLSNDFYADEGFLTSRLPYLLSNANSSLIRTFGSDKFKTYKQSQPVPVTEVTDNGDGTLTLALSDTSLFAEDDTVVIYGVPEMDTNTVVLTVIEDTSITILGEYDEEWEITDLKVGTQFFDDFSTAGAYLCAYHAVLLLRKTTAESGAINFQRFGEGSNTTISMSELNNLQQKYLDRVNDITNQYKEDDEDITGSVIFFV